MKSQETLTEGGCIKFVFPAIKEALLSEQLKQQTRSEEQHREWRFKLNFCLIVNHRATAIFFHLFKIMRNDISPNSLKTAAETNHVIGSLTDSIVSVKVMK